MTVTEVTEAHNNTLFTLKTGDTHLRAIQLADRIGGTIYANTRIEVGDHVVVVEVPGLLRSPGVKEADKGDTISHIIVGLIPPSNWHAISNYDKLVAQSG